MSPRAEIEPPYCRPEIEASMRDGRLSLAAIDVYRADDLVITRADSVDFGKDDTGSGFLYIYRFATYTIRAFNREFQARRYADTWGEVSIFLVELPADARIPYDDPAFLETAQYFFALADVNVVTAFVGGSYQPVARAAL